MVPIPSCGYKYPCKTPRQESDVKGLESTNADVRISVLLELSYGLVATNSPALVNILLHTRELLQDFKQGLEIDYFM